MCQVGENSGGCKGGMSSREQDKLRCFATDGADQGAIATAGKME